MSIISKSKTKKNRKWSDYVESTRDKIEKWDFSLASGIALKVLLQNPYHLQANPFKTFIYLLRKEEHLNGLVPAIHMSEIPDEELYYSTSAPMLNRIALYGEDDIKCAGMKHLAKLISTISLKRVMSLLASIKESLGNLPVVPVQFAFSSSVFLPISHRFECNVEAIIRGSSFDDSLTCFIRRIVEEAYNADKASNICTAHIKVVMGSRSGTIHSIPVGNVKSKRNQVLSLLKGAIVDDGEIYLEMYVFVNRILPPIESRYFHGISLEAADSCIHVVRRYRFSYVDHNSQKCRCFSKYPLDSILSGIFFDVADAKQYISIYSAHLREVTKSNSKYSEDDILSNNIDLLTDTINNCLKNGEVIGAVESMIKLQAIFTPSKVSLTHCMYQLASISTSIAGYFKAIRDGVSSLRHAMTVIAEHISNCEGLNKEGRVEMLPVELREEIANILGLYSRLSPCIIGIKQLILTMIHECSFSESQNLFHGLLNNIYLLFNPVSQAMPILDPDPYKVSPKRGLLGVVPVIHEMTVPLDRICSLLLMLEASVCDHIMGVILQRDYAGYYRPIDRYGKECDEPPRSLLTVPKNFTEMLGYINGRCAPLQVIPKTKKPIPKSWIPLEITSWLHYFTASSIQAHHLSSTKLTSSSRLGEELEDLYNDQNSSEDIITTATNICQMCARLGVNDIGRLGAIDLMLCAEEETLRKDFPKFMITEGAKFRYLAETHMMRALDECFFLTFMQPENHPPHMTLCNHLFKFGQFLNIHENVDDEMLYSTLYDCARKDAITLPTSLNKAGKVFVSSLTSINACVISHPYVAYGLGNVDNIFRLAWMIPPIIASPPSQRGGMTINVYSGLSLVSALRWGAPSISSIRSSHDAKHSVQKDKKGASAKDNHATISNGDMGSLDSLGYVQIEVAVKVTMQNDNIENKVRAAFAKFVSDSCIYLANSHQSWRLGDVSAGNLSKNASHTKGYSGVNLQRDERTVAALEAAVAKSGLATVEASMIMTDLNRLPSFDVFSKIITEALAKTAYVGSDDFEERGRDEGLKSNEIVTIFDDMERICSSKVASKTVQEAQHNSVKVYVPCQIKYTLIAMLPGSRLDAPSLKYCKVEDVVRLLCSTVWLSQEAGRAMWEMEKIIDLNKMTDFESSKHFQLFKQYHSRGQYCDALVEAHIFSLLSTRYSLASKIFRTYSCMSTKLDKVRDTLLLLTSIFEREDIVAADVTAIGTTIARHVCLAIRLIITSSESVHLQGGCYIILNNLEKLEAILKLGRLHLADALHMLPETIIPPAQSSEDMEIESAGNWASLLSRGLGLPATISGAIKQLHKILGLTTVLLEALSHDTFECIAEIAAIGKVGTTPEDIIYEALPDITRIILGNDADEYSKDQLAVRLNRDVSLKKTIGKVIRSNLLHDIKGNMKAKVSSAARRNIAENNDDLSESESINNSRAASRGGSTERHDIENNNVNPRTVMQAFSAFMNKSSAQSSTKADSVLPTIIAPPSSDDSYYYEDYNCQPSAFSVSGFKPIGDSVKSVAKSSKSMLTLLRTYSNVPPAGKPDPMINALRKMATNEQRSSVNND